MIDNIESPIPFSNLRGLLEDFTVLIDRKLTEARKNSSYEKARKSDVRVFIAASRNPRSESAIARDMDVSRQAIHSSIKRLMQMQVVELVPQPGNNKEKVVAISQAGRHAQAFAKEEIARLEGECASIIGVQGLETFRALLLALVLGLKDRELRKPTQATGV